MSVAARVAPVPVHPRVCGELAQHPLQFRQDRGSSPRVWGTRGVPDCCVYGLRFIPACVGNSHRWARTRMPAAVHPRVCGELRRRTCPYRASSGSSPRVWGTHCVSVCDPPSSRFIPACVGNSHHSDSGSGCSSVHPRVCGELPFLDRLHPYQIGSSPRVWGTLRDRASADSSRRFIPACVGNSRFVPTPILLWPVHPRVCGELADLKDDGFGPTGSSPRVWGTRGA